MSTPVYLIRHGKAGNRERWAGPDPARPLTKSGRRQAKTFVGWFDGRDLSRLVSSPFVRCVETLEPLARARGLRVETADELAEGADARRALGLILTLAAEGPTALSTHGDIVQGVLEQLLASGVPIEGPLELEKGSTWILDAESGRIAGARYLPPL